MSQFWKFNRRSKSAKKSTSGPDADKATPSPVLVQPTSSAPAADGGAGRPTLKEPGAKGDGKTLRNLWQEAFDNLDDENKVALKPCINEKGQPQPCVTEAIHEVVKSIEASFEEYSSSGLKLKNKDGKVLVDLREKGREILRFALRSKAIIDSGVKFDPTGYCMLLTLFYSTV